MSSKRATLHGDRARLFESSAAIAALIDQAQLENLNAGRRCGATPTRPVPEHCSRIGSRAPTGSGSKMWNPEVRNVGVRNETAKLSQGPDHGQKPRRAVHVISVPARVSLEKNSMRRRCTAMLLHAGEIPRLNDLKQAENQLPNIYMGHGRPFRR